MKREFELATRTYEAAVPYLDFLINHFVSFTSVQKETLKIMGVIHDAAVRQPAVPLVGKDLNELARLVGEVGLSDENSRVP